MKWFESGRRQAASAVFRTAGTDHSRGRGRRVCRAAYPQPAGIQQSKSGPAAFIGSRAGSISEPDCEVLLEEQEVLKALPGKDDGSMVVIGFPGVIDDQLESFVDVHEQI